MNGRFGLNESTDEVCVDPLKRFLFDLGIDVNYNSIK